MWIENTNLSYWKEKIHNIKADSKEGFFLEVDLTYPRQLHDLHDTFPCGPTHMKITNEMLSTYQVKLAEELGIKLGKKLCLTLLNKTKYIVHHLVLQLYLQLGLILTQVHRVLRFNQSPWLKSYIDLNTMLRQNAKSKFEHA